MLLQADSTRTTIFRMTFCFNITGDAHRLKPFRCLSDFTSVNNLVTVLAKRQTVRHIEPQLWKLSPLFNVVGVDCSSRSALLASESVTLKNGSDPFTIIVSAMLCRVWFACGLIAAFLRTMLHNVTKTFQECITALNTGQCRTGLIDQTTGVRAAFAIVRTAIKKVSGANNAFHLAASVAKNAIRFIGREIQSAFDAVFGVNHYCNYITFLERMATAFPEIEIKRIEQATAAKT